MDNDQAVTQFTYVMYIDVNRTMNTD